MRPTSDLSSTRLIWRPTPSLRTCNDGAWSLPPRSRSRRSQRWALSLLATGVVALLLLVMIRADDRLRTAMLFQDDPEPAAELWDTWLAAMDVEDTGAMPVSPARAAEEMRILPGAQSFLVRGDAAGPGDPAAPDVDASAEAGRDRSRFLRVDVTGYSSRVEETDADPFITAMCTLTAPGVVALSRDMLRTFTPDAPFDFGDKILIPGVGIYSVEDTMHPRWTRRVDIWFPSTAEAFAWGRRTAFIAEIEEETPVLAYRVPFDRTGVIELTP